MFKVFLNMIGAVVMRYKNLRLAVDYIWDRSNGLQYGSYSLVDEAELALSFVTRTGHGIGGCIIDAGANFGAYSKALINAGLCDGRVIMIEPAPALRDHLETMSKQSLQLQFESVALGAEGGVSELYFDKKGSAYASLYKRDLTHLGVTMGESSKVTVTTLDDIAAKYSLDIVDYIKLDLEGHELEALNGARRLLEEKRVKAIVFEFGGCNIDSKTFIRDFWSFLVMEHSFKLYRLLPGRRLRYLSEYSESLEQFNWQNILACAPGVIPKWNVDH